MSREEHIIGFSDELSLDAQGLVLHHEGGPVGADLFISYAWTSEEHRQWVRLLAAQLKALGFDVLIDADVDYGGDLNGFMRRVGYSKRVLLVVDRNYVDRADTMPESGVGKENRWISEVYSDRAAGWMSALFVNNPHFTLPAWLGGTAPRGFDSTTPPTAFSSSPEPISSKTSGGGSPGFLPTATAKLRSRRFRSVPVA